MSGRRPTEREYQLAIQALNSLVREECGEDEKLSYLAGLYTGVMVTERVSAEQVAALDLVEAFLFPDTNMGQR